MAHHHLGVLRLALVAAIVSACHEAEVDEPVTDPTDDTPKCDDGDADGVCDEVDVCQGDDTTGDVDGDGVCDDLDPCVGLQTTGDRDGDGVCDDVDPCDDTVVANGADCEPWEPVPVNVCGGVPIYLEGRHTGFVTCPSGGVNRLVATSGWPLDPGVLPSTGILGGRQSWYHPSGGACEDTADCTEHPYGVCQDYSYVAAYEVCVYHCASDADCGPEEACVAPSVERFYQADSVVESLGACVPATCRAASDCTSGACGLSFHWDYCNQVAALTCRDPSVDTCGGPADCADAGPDFVACTAYQGSYTCESWASQCGRPLSDGRGQAHMAATVPGAGWCGPMDAARVLAEPMDGEAAAAHWSHIGALEHASVASFSRHMLELLSLGTPADLIAGVQVALADEVAHARLAYGLASAYAGAPVGPGILDPTCVPQRSGWRQIFRGVVAEGCLGETLAAAEARWAASRVADPAVRAVLSRIADDEARHAALAWKTAVWMMSRRPWLADELVQMVDQAWPEAEAHEAPPHPLAADGLVSAREMRGLMHAVKTQVVAACVASLTAGRGCGTAVA